MSFTIMLAEYVRGLGFSMKDVVETAFSMSEPTHRKTGERTVSATMFERVNNGITERIFFCRNVDSFAVHRVQFQADLSSIIAKYPSMAEASSYETCLRISNDAQSPPHYFITEEKHTRVCQTTNHAEVPWSILPQNLLMKMGGFVPVPADPIEISTGYGRFFIVNGRVCDAVSDKVFDSCRRWRIKECNPATWHILKCALGNTELTNPAEVADFRHCARIIGFIREN